MLNKSSHAKGTIPTPVAVACEVLAARATFNLSADLAAGDLLQMQNLPAGHVPVDLIIDFDAMGAGTVHVGLLNDAGDDIDTALSGGANWLTSGDVAAAGALRADAAGLHAMSRCVVDGDADRPVVVKVATDTTATSGTIGLTLLYRAG